MVQWHHVMQFFNGPHQWFYSTCLFSSHTLHITAKPNCCLLDICFYRSRHPWVSINFWIDCEEKEWILPGRWENILSYITSVSFGKCGTKKGVFYKNTQLCYVSEYLTVHTDSHVSTFSPLIENNTTRLCKTKIEKVYLSLLCQLEYPTWQVNEKYEGHNHGRNNNKQQI